MNGAENKNQTELWYDVVLHFSDIDMLCRFPLRDFDLQTLKEEVDKMHAAGELTDEEIDTGVFGEGIVDLVDWQWYVNRYEDTFMRYEYPVSVNLKKPLTRAELLLYPPYLEPLTSERFNQLLEKAENGSITAMYQVADCYQCGNGTERDETQMSYWRNRYHEEINQLKQYYYELHYRI